MNNIVFFTGAGISVESGGKTFRGGNGLWDEYNIEDVCTPAGWNKNPALVLEFYNKRRADSTASFPNSAHLAISNFQKEKNEFLVNVMTQNVDDLHERCGADVLHLHGSLYEARSTMDPNLIYLWHKDINVGDKCEKGSQLRPNIVWFGERLDQDVLGRAIVLAEEADFFVIVGTSLEVYPVADLVSSTPENCIIYYVDPGEFNLRLPSSKMAFVRHIKEPATVGVRMSIEYIESL